MLLSVDRLRRDDFLLKLSMLISESDKRSAFVFIHGYNVTFEDAARRTAQIAYDLGFEGAPIFYSWPAKGRLDQYEEDEQSIADSVPKVRQFLEAIADGSGAEIIYLVAHSMGNRGLTLALQEMASDSGANQYPVFKEIILTVPDIDAAMFRQDIAPVLGVGYERVMLYSSDKDKVLLASRVIHKLRPRAGELIDGISVLVGGIDSIDVSGVETNLGVGHTYYGSNRSVLSDLFNLIKHDLAPDERFGLEPVEQDEGRYWRFRP